MDTPEDRPDEAVEIPAVTADAGEHWQEDAAEDTGFDDGAGGVAASAGDRRGNLLLGILGAIAVSALGVVLWGFLNANFEREFVGMSVLIGLLAGYAIRELSRRSTILTRVLATVVTALACVAGTVVGDASYASAKSGIAFRPLLDDASGNWWSLLRHRTWLQFAIYAAALVIAFLSAGPSHASRSAAAAADEAADDEDAVDLTESADPAMLPDEG